MAPHEITKAHDAYFDVRLVPDSRRSVVWKEIARYAARWMPADAHVLEVGAGYCSFINVVRAARRVALDQSDVVSTHAADGVEAVVGSVTDLSEFTADTFDVVLASNIFEHLTDAQFETALLEIRRVLRTGGRLIIMQPNFTYAYKNYFDDYTHKKIFTHVGLAGQLAVTGFDVLHVRPKFTPFSFGSVSLPVPSLLVRAYLHSPWKPLAGQMCIVAAKRS